MQLDADAVLSILREKGISSLFHANTLLTSSTFLHQGSLLSWGTVADRGFAQTPQQSDELDKNYGIWHDIFLDLVDIHSRAGGRNFYGPILFRLDIQLLSAPWLTCVMITKKNPTKWTDGDSWQDRYYTSPAEFQQHHSFGNFGSSLILTLEGGSLPLSPYLQSLIVDDPQCKSCGRDIFDCTIGALRCGLNSSGLHKFLSIGDYVHPVVLV